MLYFFGGQFEIYLEIDIFQNSSKVEVSCKCPPGLGCLISVLEEKFVLQDTIVHPGQYLLLDSIAPNQYEVGTRASGCQEGEIARNT